MEYTVSNRMSTIKGSAIREIFKYAADPEVISLAGGNPAPELFPAEALAQIANEMLTKQPTLSLQYGVTEGYTPLREAIKERLKRVENIGKENDDVLVLSGGQQGLDLSTKLLVNEGDTVIVESISRFARNTRDLLELMERLMEKRVSFVSRKEAIDTATPTGKFMLTVFGAVAELEREYILQRQREGIAIAKERGIYKGRRPIQRPNFQQVVAAWRRGEITAVEAMRRLDMRPSTFYRKVKEVK